MSRRSLGCLVQVVTCDDIRKRAQGIHATCRPIMNRPKPAPKPAEPAKEDAGAKGDAKDSATASKEDPAPAGGEEPVRVLIRGVVHVAQKGCFTSSFPAS